MGDSASCIDERSEDDIGMLQLGINRSYPRRDGRRHIFPGCGPSDQCKCQPSDSSVCKAMQQKNVPDFLHETGACNTTGKTCADTHPSYNCPDPTRGRIKTCKSYTQKWMLVRATSGGLDLKPCSDSIPDNMKVIACENNRALAVAVPNKDPPPGGWPFVMRYAFQGPWGVRQGDETRGVLGALYENVDKYAGYGEWESQNVFHGLLEAGYAVVSIPMLGTISC